MEAWVIEARGLESKQGIFTARLQETNEQRRLVEIRGVDLHLRGSDALRSHFGGKAKTLHEFGVRPRRGGRRSTKPVPSPEPQPTPQPTATKTSAPQQPATPAPPVTPGSSA
jgi:hypothetical protein